MSSLFLVVTGASRGLGRAIAAAFIKSETSVAISVVRVVLVARSKDGLLETEKQLMKEKKENQSVQVVIHVMDLSNLDKLDDHIDTILQKEASSMSQFDRIILVNNAGALGHLGSCMILKSVREFQQAIDFNVTSSIWLSVRFAQEFLKHRKSSSAGDKDTSPNCIVINVSSICAIKSFPTMAIYCAGKAARDMFHSALAQEECGEHVQFLNYAPGPCETDMTTELITCDNLDEKIKGFFRTAQTEDSLVKPEDTSRKLVKLVLEKGFESGKHVDIWDLPDDF